MKTIRQLYETAEVIRPDFKKRKTVYDPKNEAEVKKFETHNQKVKRFTDALTGDKYKKD